MHVVVVLVCRYGITNENEYVRYFGFRWFHIQLGRPLWTHFVYPCLSFVFGIALLIQCMWVSWSLYIIPYKDFWPSHFSNRDTHSHTYFYIASSSPSSNPQVSQSNGIKKFSKYLYQNLCTNAIMLLLLTISSK